MKFYIVNINYKNKTTTKVFNSFTHVEARVNENNLYTRANNHIKEVIESNKYSSIEFYEVDTVTNKKTLFTKYVKE